MKREFAHVIFLSSFAILNHWGLTNLDQGNYFLAIFELLISMVCIICYNQNYRKYIIELESGGKKC